VTDDIQLGKEGSGVKILSLAVDLAIANLDHVSERQVRVSASRSHFNDHGIGVIVGGEHFREKVGEGLLLTGFLP